MEQGAEAFGGIAGAVVLVVELLPRDRTTIRGRCKARRGLVVVSGIVGVAAAVGLFFLGTGAMRTHCFKEFEIQASDMATTVFSYFVDDCGGLPQTYGSVSPLRLNTPTGYLKQLPGDPFAVTPTPLRLMLDSLQGNSSPMAIVSVGPDRLSDMDLAMGLQTNVTTWTDYMHYVRTRPEINSVTFYYDDWQSIKELFEVKYSVNLGTQDGKVYPIPRNIMPALPPRPFHLLESPSPEPSESWLYEELINRGIVHYDPTNGSRSRGDLLILQDYGERYDPVSKKWKNVKPVTFED